MSVYLFVSLKVYFCLLFLPDLQKAVLSIYQSRLKERARRKCIIMKYGLISLKQNVEDWKRYNLLGSEYLDKMKTFMRLFTPDDFYKFMEGVLCEFLIISYSLYPDLSIFMCVFVCISL